MSSTSNSSVFVQGGVKIGFTPMTREGMISLAAAQLENKHVKPVGAPVGAKSREALPSKLAEAYLHTAENLINQGNRPVSVAHPFLQAQVSSLVPTYFSVLFRELGIDTGKTSTDFTLAEPLITQKGSNRGHYTAPFPVVRETDEMAIAQHALSTLLHEVNHALGRLVMSFRGVAPKIVQSGLTLTSSRRVAQDKDSRLFRYLDEGLMALTQMHFLQTFMRFDEDRSWRRSRSESKDFKFMLNGVDITAALLLSGTAQIESDKINLMLPYSRLSQGVGYDNSEKENWKQRDRQFLFFDSSYGVIAQHLRQFAHEIYSKSSPAEAERMFHRDLLQAQITGDLQSLSRLFRGAFGDSNAPLFIKALSAFSDVVSSPNNMELVSFVAFVRAGMLNDGDRERVRTEIAEALLTKPQQAASKTHPFT